MNRFCSKMSNPPQNDANSEWRISRFAMMDCLRLRALPSDTILFHSDFFLAIDFLTRTIFFTLHSYDEVRSTFFTCLWLFQAVPGILLLKSVRQDAELLLFNLIKCYKVLKKFKNNDSWFHIQFSFFFVHLTRLISHLPNWVALVSKKVIWITETR